jgi:hypothetical protein
MLGKMLLVLNFEIRQVKYLLDMISSDVFLKNGNVPAFAIHSLHILSFIVIEFSCK